jgi:hypothetical protein
VPLCEGSALAAGLSAKETGKAKQAKQLYKEGQYETAAKIFSSLSSDHPEMLVFTRNLGACYYYLRRPEPALSNLREYLRREQDIRVEDRREVEGWIAEMEKLRGQPSATPSLAPAAQAAPILPETHPPAIGATPPSPAPAPLPEPTAMPLPLVPAESSQPTTGAVPVEAVTTAPQPPARSSNALAWVAGGIGVAGLAAGGVFTALALNKFSTTESQYNPSAESSGKTYAALQWVGYGVGAAGIATAVVLFTLNPKPSNTVALTPMLGHGFAGASVAGTY